MFELSLILMPAEAVARPAEAVQPRNAAETAIYAVKHAARSPVAPLRTPAVWGKGWPAADDGGNQMLLVTGGAGFIGSNVVAALNEAGRSDIVVDDVLGGEEKWRNLAKRQVADMVAPGDVIRWLDHRKLDAVIHLGAISDTTATDADLMMENNFRTSLRLLDWCTSARVPFIYASSAATYGDGAAGFDDDWSPMHLQKLKPMNLYGWSKQMFDQAVAERVVKKEKLPPQWAGLKFFNVFGPNEYHKGEMMSLVAKRFDDAKAGRSVKLFKSHREGIGDGEQRRDFIYVDDAVAVVRWLMQTPAVSGIFNVGTGKARSFRDLISALFCALGKEPKIEYIDMPENIRGQYQYFTEANVENLMRAGYNAGFTSLEDGVTRYVTQFLNTVDRYR
jgi:ADP-L-glycero-D-manno-heptose 6-epimerase